MKNGFNISMSSNVLIRNPKGIIPHKWIPSGSPFKIHIAFEQGTEILSVIELINMLRRIRVGSEARFMPICVWIDLNETKINVLEALAQIDSSVPRIKVFIILNPSNCEDDFVDCCKTVIKFSLKSRFICVLSGKNAKDLQLIEKIYQSPIREHMVYEWFPSFNDRDCSKALSLVEALDTFNYSFRNHPLALCGIISSIIREIQSVKERYFPDHKNLLRPKIDFIPFEFLDIDCSLELMKRISPIIKSLNLSCFCLNQPNLDVRFEKSLKKISEDLVKVEDLILFEDWQYIYDGF